MIKHALLFLTVTAFFSGNINAQSKKVKDREAIKKMCGCYDVGFNFAETFSYSKDTTYQPSKVKHAKALEWVQLIEDKDDKIVMQHLLIINKNAEPHVIKHWRQDWVFENTDFYMYDVDSRWRFVQKPVKAVQGQWTQKVYQIDDSPRYGGSSSWVHVDGKSYWENTTDAPLPRREYTKRKDYNVMVRRNRHEITNNGWKHDQDNDKVIRTPGKEDVLLAQEKGYNTYEKVDDSKCKIAREWWKKHKDLWQVVRRFWDEVFSKDQNLELALKVEDKRLSEYLTKMETKAEDQEIKKIINKFVK